MTHARPGVGCSHGVAASQHMSDLRYCKKLGRVAQGEVVEQCVQEVECRTPGGRNDEVSMGQNNEPAGGCRRTG